MSKKTIAIILVLLLGVGALAIYPAVKDYMITKDPINHIMYSAVKTNKETNLNATVSVTTELDEQLALEQGIFNYASQDPEAMAKFANSLLKKFEILYDINMITDGANDLFKMDGEIGVNYSNKALVNGKFYLKPWELCVELPKLYNKAFYIDINDAIKAEGYEYDLNDINFEAYINLFKKEDDLYKAVLANYEPYKQVIYDYLDGKVEKLGKSNITLNVYGQEKQINTTKYKLNINIFDIYDVYAKLLEIAKKDEAVKALVAARVAEFKNLVIENKDYEKLGLTEEEFNEGMKEVENGLVNNWDKGIDEIIKELKSIPTKPEFSQIKGFGSDYIMAIDKENRIRQVEIELQSQFIRIKEVASYNAFGSEVKVSDIKEDTDKIRILELENNDALVEEIGKDVANNLVSELVGGEAVEQLISDIKTESKILPAEESQQIIQSIDMMLNQIQMTLPMMLEGSMGIID